MRHPIDFDGINAVALRSARQLLQELLPGGKFQGDEYVVRNPLRNDQHPGSFKINCKTGEWGDFAIGKSGGDLISLVAYLRGISPVDAARELAQPPSSARPASRSPSTGRRTISEAAPFTSPRCQKVEEILRPHRPRRPRQTIPRYETMACQRVSY
jgi:hypothetical protein